MTDDLIALADELRFTDRPQQLEALATLSMSSSLARC